MNRKNLCTSETKSEMKNEMKSGTKSAANDLRMCRICLESDSASNLLEPCECRGTCRYVHRKCLDRWLHMRHAIRRAHFKCEICKAEYSFDESANNLKRLSSKWQSTKAFIFTDITQFYVMVSSFVVCVAIMSLYNVLLSGSLDVTIHSAVLPDMDVLLWRKSDAYAVVCVERECVCETEIRDDTNHPNWNHECHHWLNKSVSIVSKITFLVYDADSSSDDDFIGGVSLPVYQMLLNGYNDKDVILKWDKPYAGSLAITMKWWPNSVRWFQYFSTHY